MSSSRKSTSSNFDWISFSLYFSLVVIGLLMLYATDYKEGAELLDFTRSFQRQLVWVSISTAVFLLALIVDWKVWSTFAYPIFGLSIFLLLFVLIFGSEIKGAKAWIVLFGFSFQPSEFAKFGTCLALSSFISSSRFSFSDLKSNLTLFGLIVLPALLIIMQPDAGSAIVFGSFFVMFFRSGLTPAIYILGLSFILVFIFSLIYSPYAVMLALFIAGLFFYVYQLDNRLVWFFAVAIVSLAAGTLFFQGFRLPALLGLVALLSIFMIYLVQKRKSNYSIMLFSSIIVLSVFSFGSNYAFHEFLAPHQKDRINVWLQPEITDPHGSRYNLIQSQAAIGSGGLQGKGFLNGTMTKLNYVPEQSTDFIFSTIGEEQGFIGSIGIVVLFSILLIRMTIIAERSRSKFILHFAYGFAGILFFHYFINIGMTMGLMPIVGIPLPFISKGGSSLLIFSLMMGILLKMDMDRLSRL